MIKFFRRIRKRFLIENKITRYLIYAIGEIGLIMIGILLALQVTNWNNNKLSKAKEKELLYDLLENLKVNIDQLKTQIKRDSQIVASSTILLEKIKIKASYSDTLDYHFNQPRKAIPPTLTFSAYHTIENYGFEIISSKSLRKEIIILYDATYPTMINIVENFNRDKFAPNVESYFIENFELHNDSSKPNNYELIMGDQKFKNLVKFAKEIREWTLNLRIDCLNKAENLKYNIEHFLHLH